MAIDARPIVVFDQEVQNFFRDVQSKLRFWGDEKGKDRPGTPEAVIRSEKLGIGNQLGDDGWMDSQTEVQSVLIWSGFTGRGWRGGEVGLV